MAPVTNEDEYTPGCVCTHAALAHSSEEGDDGDDGPLGPCKNCDCPRYEATDLPIDLSEPMSNQSRRALLLAEQLGLVVFRRPVDTRQPAHVDLLLQELAKVARTEPELPADPGIYYLIFMKSGRRRHQPVLIPEGEVRAFVLALALREGRETADQVVYRRGMLPL